MAKDSYHKENLRGDLIRAALAYVAEHGYVSLSVRTLAQKVGVSPGAPYHHFPDRRSLLLAVALEGFRKLIGEALEIEKAALDGVARLEALGLSFIRYADANPRLLELMYESELTTPEIDPQLQQFQEVGQRLIRGSVRSELPDAEDADVEIRAVLFWSAVYGFAALRRKHNIQSFDDYEMAADDVARSVIGQAARTATLKS
jgi:AcrR family transcriptional regulator